MPRTIFTFTDPAGQPHQRTSESRTYSHAVISQRRYTSHLRDARNQSERLHRSNFDYYQRVVNTGIGNSYVSSRLGSRDLTVTVTADDYSRAMSALRGKPGMSFEDYLLLVTTEAIAEVERLREKTGFFTEWVCHGYCGRPDLAQKLASKTEANDYWQSIQIVPVTPKGAH